MNYKTILTARVRKRLFRSFQSKIWPCHSLRRPRFPLRRINFHYPITFANIFYVFVHNFHLTLWPWPTTFWPWQCLVN